MRTTVNLETPLLTRARRRAAQRGQTLSELVREAVSTYLADRAVPTDEEPFDLLTCGNVGGDAPSPAEMAEQEDIETACVAPRSQNRRART